MTHPLDHIKAVATTAELLSALECFEATGCQFGLATNAYIRAWRRDPNAETFVLQSVMFEAATFPRMVLILTHVAKPHHSDMDRYTLRPFAEALVTHGASRARLVAPSAYTAWVELELNGTWRRLGRPSVPPRPPAPTTVIEPAIPAAPERAEEAPS